MLSVMPRNFSQDINYVKDERTGIQEIILEYCGPEGEVPKLPIPFHDLFRHMFRKINEEQEKQMAETFKGEYAVFRLTKNTLNTRQIYILSTPVESGSKKSCEEYMKEHNITVQEASGATFKNIVDRYVCNYMFLSLSGTGIGIITAAICPVGEAIILGGLVLGLVSAEVKNALDRHDRYCKAINHIKSQKYYQDWDKIRQKQLLFDSFHQFLLQDSLLKNYVCHISGQIPIVPVKFKNGVYTYEMPVIRRWLRKNPNTIFEGEPKLFTEKDLEYDYAFQNSTLDIFNRIIDVMDRDESLAKMVNFSEIYGQLTEIKKQLKNTIEINMSIAKEKKQAECARHLMPEEEVKKWEIQAKNSRKIIKDYPMGQHLDDVIMAPSPDVFLRNIDKFLVTLFQRTFYKIINKNVAVKKDIVIKQ
jgi:hypothetical protein